MWKKNHCGVKSKIGLIQRVAKVGFAGLSWIFSTDQWHSMETIEWAISPFFVFFLFIIPCYLYILVLFV